MFVLNGIYLTGDMDIHELKKILFSQQQQQPSTISKRFVDLTGSGTVKYSNVNAFTSEEHKLTFECDQCWLDELLGQLKETARGLIEPEHFDHYWEQCRKPTTTISMETYAYTKRGHKKIFVNMYNDATGEEFTGLHKIQTGAIVKVYVSWALIKTETEGYIQYGWRPFFGRGIRVCSLSQNPYVFKRPWDWSVLSADTETVPMYPSFIIKTPALRVQQSEDRIITSAPHLVFDKQMDSLHRLLKCQPWDHKIYVHKPVNRRQLLLASIYPIRNKDEISWHTSKLVVRRAPSPPNLLPEVLPEAAAAAEEEVEVLDKEEGEAYKKRAHMDRDNTDNFFGVKTKRQCTRGDNDAHI